MFGLVVVLNGGKIYIEKMVGLGEMLSIFFLNLCVCFGHNLAITHPIELLKIMGKLDF